MKVSRMLVYAGLMGLPLFLQAAGAPSDYPMTDVNRMLADECARRGIEIVDYHLHVRGGMTPEKCASRERAWIVRSSAMDNHGREWETRTDE